MNDRDFEGLRDRNDEQAQMGIEQQRAISEILDDLDAGKRLNSGQMLLLRWYVGIPNEMNNPNQIEMNCTCGEE